MWWTSFLLKTNLYKYEKSITIELWSCSTKTTKAAVIVGDSLYYYIGKKMSNSEESPLL